ncbi:hypothetical protein BE15_41575 [Sorangium cellulosum]|uniref:Secreted protein n=1 Tax=Sorangium cellulosum TaxID=56 RepID=A0A150QDN1_SORCE|nr:hypothetical protein BE15_41575 [Sorangium cellulosum]
MRRFTSLAALLVAAGVSCAPPHDAGDPDAAEASDAVASQAADAEGPGDTGRARSALVTAAAVLPAAELDRVAYAAAAAKVNDPRLDLLADATSRLAARHPGLTAAEYQSAIAEMWTRLEASQPNALHDLSGQEMRFITRTLARMVPGLGSGAAADALREAARSYLSALRSDLDEIRKVSPLDALHDQHGAAQRFREACWERLHAAARESGALAAAVDGSVLEARLAVSTSDPAIHILGVHQVEPLRSFVLANVQADGSLSASQSAVETLIEAAGSAALAQTRAYADNLFALDAAEQEFLSSRSPVGAASAGASALAADASDAEAKLKKAIEDATKKQKQLADKLDSVKSGATGALRVAAKLASLSNDPGFADDIEILSKTTSILLDTFSKHSKGALETASKLAGILKLGDTGFKVLGAAVFTGDLVGAVFQIISLFSRDDKPSINEKILQNLRDIRELVGDVRTEMHARFDRLDQKLNDVYDAVMEQFEHVNFELGKLEVDLEEVQLALYTVQADLNRLDRNMYAFLDAAERQPLVEGIAGFLNYEQRTGLEMAYSPTFLDGENRFYTWSYFTSKDAIQAGPTSRSFDDAQIATELGNYPLATNINYLSELSAVRFGLSRLSTERLANPLTWMTAAESYAQLGEEWPEHAGEIDPGRLERVIDAGEDLAAGLDRIASPALMRRLSDHYRGKVTALSDAIAQFEATFEGAPSRKLHGIDLWSGADQVPTAHDITGNKQLPSCRNKAFSGGRASFELDLGPFAADYAPLAPLMIADNLGGLSDLKPCIHAAWTWEKATELPWGWNWTFRLDFAVRVNYGATTVHDIWFTTSTRQTRLIRTYDPPFDPDTFWSPEGRLTEAVWSQRALSWRQLLATSALLNQARTAVHGKLEDLQRQFYGQVATKLGQLGDPIQVAGSQLTGSKALWESYVALGFPLSLEQNDALRALLYGGESLLTGAGGGAGALSSVRDIYLAMSQADDLPEDNLLPAVVSLSRERSDRLLTTLNDINAEIRAAEELEGSALVRGTLTRLYLLKAQTPGG